MDFFTLTLKRFVSKTKVCYLNVENQYIGFQHVPNVCHADLKRKLKSNETSILLVFYPILQVTKFLTIFNVNDLLKFADTDSEADTSSTE